MRHFQDVSLLITTYNRSRSLERLLETFRDLQISFAEIVVSDDASRPEHLNHIRELKQKYGFRLMEARENGGLAANMNKGQAAAVQPYILYVQEDFEPLPGCEQHIGDALELMREDPDIDIARFYAYFAYPYTQPYKKGFSKMIFKPSPLAANHIKFYVYSDHPHLRRSNFEEKFGKFRLGIGSDRAEFEMALSFIKNGGKGIFYDKFNTVFEQRNSAEEPSTIGRASWRSSKSPLLLMVRAVYLRFKLLKWTWDLSNFGKLKK